MRSIGGTLKDLRINKQITQEELANDLNNLYNIKINKGMISKWESNKSEPIFKYVKLFSDYYNVSVDYLLGLTEFRNINDELNNNKNKMISFSKNYNDSFFENKLLESYSELNNLGKKEAIKRVEELTYIDKYKNTKVTELHRKKEIWEEEGKEHLTPIAAHDDGLTDEEKENMNNIIDNFLKNKK
ncbi:MAG: hypothetical protein DBY38_01950 [Clostridium cadaveris]|uniref:HTH cro/C1-type domain-containing protein n=1 Tax=Clostridium cadaveris TaxID=1529 RepID=A0A316MDQ3_9CLOT|nr:helix-turn-helix transcriptional regulator [Clostridium cadaveris]MDU4953827.1 helix-turn-helix transcriptional regulator [Clostridium sp.]NWK12485.1 helix-turn-helix transcriptional regulator [Clostridium cadaveris]PWL55359.1 MAG: hypothetical protein DBY38_01950 [Clostridium cadaveris]